jgi:hypothetical protein
MDGDAAARDIAILCSPSERIPSPVEVSERPCDAAPMNRDGSARLHQYLLIGLISCSVLMYEVLLIRVCALRLAFHFGFLVISNCLLAVGASGTLITLRQDSWRKRPRFWTSLFAALYVLSVLLTYLFLVTYPVDSPDTGLVDLRRVESLTRFVFFNLMAAVPFFFGGAVVGMLLSFNAERVNRLYFVDLVGAAAGCLLSPWVLSWFGAGGCLVALAVLALLGLAAAIPTPHRLRAAPLLVAAMLTGIALVPFLDGWLPVPGRNLLALTRDHEIDTSKPAEFTRWTATSRIDMVEGFGKGGGIIYTRGTNIEGQPPVPDQKIIMQDADAGTVLVDFSSHPEALEIIRRSMYSAAVRLKKAPKVLVIGVGGGNDLWAAQAAGARYVKGVELNGPIVEIHTKIFPDYTRALIEDPRIHLLVDEGRSALSREADRFDVIQLTGVDTWTGLKSGAYVLAENYLYTKEAITTMYDRLAPGGILQIIRMAKDMEALRMVANIDAAMQTRGLRDLRRSLIAMHTGDPLMAFLLKKGVFNQLEVNSTLRFIADNGIQPVYLPGYRTGRVVEEFIQTRDKQAYIDAFPRDISPTTDDRPYFFNFTRWTDPFRSREFIEEPTHVSQGNPFFILGQLGVGAALSLLLIVVPLIRLGGERRAGTGRFLVYFAGVGLGFIMIEIGMMQKLTVFLGHPIYSVTVTLASVLFFAGVGSFVSARWFRGSPRRAWGVPAGLAALVFAYLVAWPAGFDALVGLPLPARIGLAVAILAPISLLLGVPFAYGIRLLNERNPSIIPWAWAVNGCFSVIGSILTVVVSMTIGFAATLAVAVAIYAVAFAAVALVPEPAAA